MAETQQSGLEAPFSQGPRDTLEGDLYVFRVVFRNIAGATMWTHLVAHSFEEAKHRFWRGAGLRGEKYAQIVRLGGRNPEITDIVTISVEAAYEEADKQSDKGRNECHGYPSCSADHALAQEILSRRRDREHLVSGSGGASGDEPRRRGVLHGFAAFVKEKLDLGG